MITVKSLASSSAGNAYTVSDGVSTLLLECGIPWKKIQQGVKFKTSSIAGCLVSHSHGDHCKAINDLLYHSVPVYASRETFDATRRGGSVTGVNIIDPKKPFTIGSWWVVAFPTEHDTPGSLGFLLRNNSGEYCLFLTDSAYSRFAFPPLHTIIIEANFSLEIVNENIRRHRGKEKEGELLARKRRLIDTHLSVERVIDLLNANDLTQCRAIHLIHLSNDNSDEKLFKRMVQEETGVPVVVEAA